MRPAAPAAPSPSSACILLLSLLFVELTSTGRSLFLMAAASNRQLGAKMLTSLGVASSSSSVGNPARPSAAVVADQEENGNIPPRTTSSLGGDYLVRCSATTAPDNECTFSLYPLLDVESRIDASHRQSDGARSWAALHQIPPTAVNEPAALVLRARVEGDTGSVSVSKDSVDGDGGVDGDLVDILSRVLGQWALLCKQQQNQRQPTATTEEEAEGRRLLTVQLPDTTTELFVDSLRDDDSIRELFGDKTGSEIVEMVDRFGKPLGRVPRKLVHAHNLLHRGIGMFVTSKDPILISSSSDEAKQPDLYVHRRTDSKRIFPSLYDMFVGGVSLAAEDPAVTALREVAEELGLAGNPDQLSDPITTCVVCTAYNRCVVVLFGYAMNTEREQISWQEEEVAWGAFVPYDVVVAAADRSIQRLAGSGTWPGSVPPFQSRQHGNVTTKDDDEWKTWDFVPDGLLVWEAWMRWLEQRAE